MLAGAYYEIPFGYTGIITGIWASVTGGLNVTELANAHVHPAVDALPGVVPLLEFAQRLAGPHHPGVRGAGYPLQHRRVRGGAIASLRFNGDTTTGNYSSSYSPLTSTTKTNTLGTFAGAKLGQNGVTGRRSGQVTIYNVSGTMHPWTCVSTTEAAANTQPVTSVGSGVWTGSGQITSIQLIVDTNGITMPAGTGLVIYGQNP